MLSFLKKLFTGSKPPIGEMLEQGAAVIDVRTKSEFAAGHVAGSINIPLDQISSKINELKKHKAIIVCCRSGNRSAQAKNILQSSGISNVVNGGSWQNVNTYKIK